MPLPKRKQGIAYSGDGFVQFVTVGYKSGRIVHGAWRVCCELCFDGGDDVLGARRPGLAQKAPFPP